MNFGKNPQYDFPKMKGGGGQRPFGTFPKIHPFWKGQASHRSSKISERTSNSRDEEIFPKDCLEVKRRREEGGGVNQKS